MKKILLLILVSGLMLMTGTVYAVEGYSFSLEYTGKVEVGVEKDAEVKLIGTNGTTYTNVRIKVDIEGPATPKILAYDSSGVQHDIAQLGYWGPDAGFSVQGDFTNTTPIKATFSVAGEYDITLSLIDVANNNTVITTETITIEVSDVEQPGTDNEGTTGGTNDGVAGGATTENTTNNTITEIPKAGMSYAEMIIWIATLFVAISAGYIIYQRKVNA